MAFLKNCFYIFFLFSIFLSCETNKIKTTHSKITYNSVSLQHAKSFTIEKNDSIVKLTVFNPWQGAEQSKFHYYFSDKINNDSIIKIPIKNAICFSSSHIAFLKELNNHEIISGISGCNFIYDSTVQQLISDKQIYEVGYESSINYEKILENKPEIAFVYGVGNEHAAYVSKLEELGVKAIYIAEYLENTPLGRLEWIKFFGYITNSSSKADSIFNSEINSYFSIVDSSKSIVAQKHRVFSGSPIGDVWYVPGGNSYMANFIKDANANYIFVNNSLTESTTKNYESAFLTLKESNYWINCDFAQSVNQILEKDNRFALLNNELLNNLYDNDKRIGMKGGNDFWEKGIVKPSYILKDLAKIFHPMLFPDYELYFYRKL